MPYKVENNDLGVTRVIYSGSVDLKERMKAVDDVCKSIKPPDQVKLLIDVRNIKNDMSEQEQGEFAKYLASRVKLENAKVAVLHSPQNNPNLIINTFAYIEGYQTVPFVSENDAKLWLAGKLK